MYYLELGTIYINVFYLTYKKQKIHISLHVASSPLRPLPTELSLSGYRVPLDWAKIEPVHKKLKLSKNFQLLSETIDNPVSSVVYFANFLEILANAWGRWNCLRSLTSRLTGRQAWCGFQNIPNLQSLDDFEPSK